MLKSTERYIRVEHVVTVDPDRTRLELVRHRERAVQVLSEYRRSETIDSVVGLTQNVLLVLKLNHYADRPKDLLLHNAHVRRGIGEDSWLDEVSFVTMSIATNVDRGTVLLSRINVSHDTLPHDIASANRGP